MGIPLTGLKVQQFIVHEIPRQPRASSTTAQPNLSSAPSVLTDRLRAFFERKIGEAASSSACFRVEFDPVATSPVPDIIRAWFEDTGDLVASSQEMARHLAKKQNAVNSEGLLAAVPFEHGSLQCLALLKLENEDGVRVRRSGSAESQRLDLELIDDLLLTRKTRTFKQAVIMQLPGEEYSVWVTDHQRGYAPSRPVAAFFLHEFLGCRLLVDARVATRNFFTSVKEFSNTQIAAEDERLALDIHTVSFLTENAPTISINDFASRYLPVESRRDFRIFVAERDVPADTFEKDIELIRPRLRTVAYHGAAGFRVKGPPDAFKARVEFEDPQVVDGADGETIMKIRDRFTGQT